MINSNELNNLLKKIIDNNVCKTILYIFNKAFVNLLEKYFLKKG